MRLPIIVDEDSGVITSLAYAVIDPSIHRVDNAEEKGCKRQTRVRDHLSLSIPALCGCCLEGELPVGLHTVYFVGIESPVFGPEFQVVRASHPGDGLGDLCVGEGRETILVTGGSNIGHRHPSGAEIKTRKDIRLYSLEAELGRNVLSQSDTAAQDAESRATGCEGAHDSGRKDLLPVESEVLPPVG